MYEGNPRSTGNVGRTAFFPIFAPFAFACFAGALITDLIYWRTPDVMWETFSIWLIFAGVVMAGFAILAAIIDFARSERIRASMPAWLYAFGSAIALVLALFNAFVHSRDGYTAVVPTGLTLSALVVIILLVTSWIGGALGRPSSAGASL
jgi:uncharacterized membrane protein